MSNQEPVYIIKWVAGVAASVLAAFIITYFVPARQEQRPARLINYDADGKSVSFVYPEFLGPVKSTRLTLALVVSIGSMRGGVSDIILGGELGQMSIAVQPTAYFYFNRPTREARGETSNQEQDYFEDAETISRIMTDKEESPFDFYEEVEKEGLYKVTRLIVQQNALASVFALFNKFAWDKHQDVIRESIRSISLNEENVIGLFEADAWVFSTVIAGENGKPALRCQTSLWTPERLEAVGCDRADGGTNENAVRYQCGENYHILFREMTLCEEAAQKSL